MPLHDHPSMIVFSKILYGKMHWKAFDWIQERYISLTSPSTYITQCKARLVFIFNHIDMEAMIQYWVPHMVMMVIVVCTQNSHSNINMVNAFAFLARLAKIIANTTITPETPAHITYPDHGGNVHSFEAEEPCALFDIITPPYPPNALLIMELTLIIVTYNETDRQCTYYEECSITITS